MNQDLELRMYGLVPYNLSPIQQGIQFGHAVVEYGQMIKQLKSKTPEKENISNLEEVYNNWADNWKTFIILNGGTTNSKINSQDDLPFGTINKHLLKLNEIGITSAKFYEPDLGDQLTAVVFIVDERVFNKKKYPDLGDWILENYKDSIAVPGSISNIVEKIKKSKNSQDKKIYKKWQTLIGGEKNEALREFLKNFKLA